MTADLALQLLIVVVGLIAALNIDQLTASIDLGTTPTWKDFIFALTAGDGGVHGPGVRVRAGGRGRRGPPRAQAARVQRGVSASLIAYVGIALVAISALPVVDGRTELGRREYIERAGPRGGRGAATRTGSPTA